jgi:HSP20 family protein
MANYLTPGRRGSLARGSAGGFGGSLFDLHRQMNSLFDDLVEGGSPSQGFLGGTGWPQLEIEHDDERIQVCAELPGVEEDDIDLTIEDGMLTLSGEKRSERKEGGYSERSYGRFERRIALPSDVEEDACQADFRNGVLTVTLPRSAEKARGRRIPLGGQGRKQDTIEAQNDREERPRQQAAEESEAGKQQG